MKLKIAVAFSCLLGFSNVAYAQLDFQYQELPKDRNSREYGVQIKALEKVIDGYKWVADNGFGFIITSIPNPIPTATSDRAVNGLYFGMQRFYYNKEQVRTIPYELYARQSERSGYVELWDDESSRSMHVKVIDDDTLEVFNDAKERNEKDRLIYKKAAKFENNPQEDRLESAEESGVFH
ncbi:hypothetical protein [Pseudomonas sp. P1.8]|jgi:hypothetical protein|uniref:hypothetical protein n=1 Tax=Pseudomonas sp. P1.8 TaxID=1699310 RepID=UPI00069EBEAA|nr:hypothetical protein [Pseudomonas sp. P1.8]